MSSEAMKLARLKNSQEQRTQLLEMVKTFEPLVTLIAGASAIGFLNRHYMTGGGSNGRDTYPLINDGERMVLLAGLIAIEMQRAGLFHEAVEGVGAVSSGIANLVPAIAGLIK